jgi:hypothetical protein
MADSPGQRRPLAMVGTALSRIIADLVRRVGELTSGPRWLVRVTPLIAALSISLHFPGYVGALRGQFDNAFHAVELKASKPLQDMALLYAPETNYSKRTFRITGPLLARVVAAEGKLALVVLQTVIGFVFIALVLVAVETITADRTAAALVGAALSLTYPGYSAFGDFHFFFDGLAYCLLLAAVVSSHPIAIASFTFLASWTDERAVIAASLVALFHLYKAGGAELSPRSLRSFGFLGVFLGVSGYLALRALLTVHLSHVVPSGERGQLGLALLARHSTYLPIGAWSGLEGLWVIVVAAFAILVGRRQWVFTAALASSVATMVIAAHAVLDITRSVAYALPAVFLALAIVHHGESPKFLRGCAVIALVLSFAWPYDVGGGGRLSWQASLPVEIVKVLWEYGPRLWVSGAKAP